MGVVTTDRSPDLQPVFDEDRWERATRASDDPILPLLLKARERAAALTDRAVERIAASIPAYADESLVSRDDLWMSVSRNLDINLLVLAERRDLTATEIAARAALGARRAEAGISISDLLRAFRVGYLVLWEGLTEVARDLGPETVNHLLDDAGRIWEYLDRISSGVADTYRETLVRHDVDVRRRALAFVGGLASFPEGRHDTEAAVRALGLDLGGPFVAAVCSGYVAGLREHGAVIAEQPDRTVVMVQPSTGSRFSEAQLRSRLEEAAPGAVGLGMAGHGLAGARRSLSEAERAHRCAEAMGVQLVSWRESWFDCLVAEVGASLEPLVADAVTELERSAETAETLAALVAENGNTTAAARRLHVHPNTVAYRVQRLRELSGLDVKGENGLMDAHLALALVRRHHD